MKRSAPKTVHYESGPNMTPLVDVVMVILIFLMLAGSFGATERYMSTTLPEMADGHGPARNPVDREQPVRIEISVRPNGDVVLPDTDRPILERRELTAALADRLKRHTDNGRAVETVQLVIKPAADTEWDKIAPIYGAAMSARFTNIGFKAVATR